MAQSAVFLDRDDTIIADPGYLNSPDQVKLLAGAGQGINELSKMGFKLVIVSNQSGIARGIFTEETLGKIHERLKELLAGKNAHIDEIYYCPYHRQGSIPKYRKDSDERKPKPGMLLRATKEMDLELESSWMIGNSYRDIAAGKSAGTKTILIKSHTNRPVKSLADPNPDFEAINLREAANIIRRETGLTAAAKKAPPSPETKEPQPEISEKTKAPEPAGLQAQEPRPEPSPVLQPEQKTAPTEQNTEKPQTPAGRTEELLEEIKYLLKSKTRQESYDEFSAVKLIAGVVQIMALTSLFIAVLYKMSPADKSISALTSIGFAVALQLLALTLYIMHNDRK